MTYIKNLLKALLFNSLLILLLSFILTILYHTNIISNSIYRISCFIIPSITLFITTFLLGKKATKKGWLEGLKLGSLTILIFLIITSTTATNISLKISLYYFILLLVSITGAMIGINQKSE